MNKYMFDVRTGTLYMVVGLNRPNTTETEIVVRTLLYRQDKWQWGLRIFTGLDVLKRYGTNIVPPKLEQAVYEACLNE